MSRPLKMEPRLKKLEASLLLRLAPGDILDGFSGFDDAGDRLDQPGVQLDAERARSELLDQDHLIPLGIVRKDCDRLATLEDFSRDLGPFATGEQAVS